MRLVSSAALVLALLSPLAVLAQPTPAAPAISVPRLVNITGVFQPADGQPPAPVEVVTLAIYSEPDGGLPLWQEMQTITPDKTGRFTVLLGASHPDGLPPEVFASGEARWMSLRFARAGEVERPRVRITSVPYALKASDAETLGGRPASAYLLAPTEGDEARPAGGSADPTVATSELAEAAKPLLPEKKPPVVTSLVLPGTTNFLAKYVNSVDVGNSGVFEIGGRVGMGTGAATPADRLHLRINDTSGAVTGLAVQNMGNTATSYSGMLFYDQFGALGQFQGFNNVTHEYSINNIATNGSINFKLGGASRLRINPTGGTFISAGGAPVGLQVDGSGDLGIGVTKATGTASYARSSSGYGAMGSTDTGNAVVGFAGIPTVGYAGVFDRDVRVIGTLFKGANAFQIDHPLDPENKYLSHSAVESPDMKNIYDGVAVLDEAGEAIVALPDWFEALNGDFRYQLTPMGAAFVPYVAEEIAGNQFKIGGGVPGMKVSWQVTGIRHDAFANANRIQVEEQKSDAALGTYLHPEAFGQPVGEEMARLRVISQRPVRP